MLGERIARASSRVFARFWLAEMDKIAEQISDPPTRWAILRQALAQIAKTRP